MSSLLDGLNPEQREVVCATDGPVLVLAGAGTGKTRAVTRRIAYLVKRGLAEPEEILAVTFTNKAAGEMRERVAELVGAKRAKGILLSTFHAFCVHVLRAEIESLGYRRNFSIASESDARTLLRRVLEDLADSTKVGMSSDELLSRISMFKNGAGANGEDVPDPNPSPDDKYARWTPEVIERYQSALRAANTLDFDDLLALTLRLWREHPGILKRYQQRFRYVMVDEFQDTNPVQFALLRNLVAAHRNLCVVGDDDQAIYSWRGAGIENIVEFERHFADARVIRLEQNYRSTKVILDAANSVIANNEYRREKKLWTTQEAGREIDWLITGDDEHEAKEVVAWFQRIQQRTGAAFKDFALLYRSNIQSRPFEIAFRQAGIPYVVFGGQAFFERAEVKDIVAYLRVLSNPRDEAAFLRVVNVPRRGIGDATLHEVHELCRVESLTLGKSLAAVLIRGKAPLQAANGIRSFLDMLSDFRRRLRDGKQRLSDCVRELVDRIDYRGELGRVCKTPEQAEMRWTNVMAVADAVADYEARFTNPTLAGFLDESSLDGSRDQRGGQDKARDAVSLMTIHSAKGLEYPFVFIVGAEEGLMPHERSLKEGGLEEERRLFYVALTRAQRHATIFEAVSRIRNGRERMTHTSRFIKEIPEALIKSRVLAVRDMVQERVGDGAAKAKKPKRKARAKRAAR
ncbi:MAG: UvrD-helicase domain-containing protein [Candidatus Hydrogenedentales bacterium]